MNKKNKLPNTRNRVEAVHEARSQKYQWKLVEKAIGPDLMALFTDEYDPFAAGRNELLAELKEELHNEYMRLIRTTLTERQLQVLSLYVGGYTQCEVAKKLGICQSTVVKTISGNSDNRHGNKRYGGCIKKLREAASRDERIQEILRKMNEIEL